MNDDITQIYEKISREIEHNHLHTMTLGGAPNNPQVLQIHGLLEAVRVAASSREVVAAHALLQKVRLWDMVQSMELCQISKGNSRDLCLS